MHRGCIYLFMAKVTCIIYELGFMYLFINALIRDLEYTCICACILGVPPFEFTSAKRMSYIYYKVHFKVCMFACICIIA